MKRLALFVFALLLVVTTGPVAAQNDVEEEIEEVAQEIAELEARMEAADGEQHYWVNQVTATSLRMQEIQEDLGRAEITLADLQVSVAETQKAIELTTAEIDAKELELANTRKEIEATHELVGTQAVELFKHGGSQIEVAFDYQSVQEAALVTKYGSRLIEETTRAIDALEALRGQEELQIELINQQEGTLAEQLERLELAATNAEEQKALIEESRRLAEAELLNQRTLLQTVKATIAEFDNELDGLEEEQGRLEQLLAETQPSGGQAPGSIFRPVPGAISSPFGPRVHPILGYTRQHTGLDMNAGAGDQIVAAAGGEVIVAGWYGGYGNAVIIDHGGAMATLYAHQTSVAVSVGNTVRAGQVIGYVGSTGLSTAPHLHFEVRLDGSPVDPVPYFQS
ncbi:MAG: peptidoglycan DD-metalloendopeptidase family protein [Acidimicrobiia bacterium]|nr:peptidoglycan DD-metalloendopeptidase family protein [Acidimicrobiia bacterium]